MSAKTLKIIQVVMVCIAFLFLFSSWMTMTGVSSEARAALDSEIIENMSSSALDDEGRTLVRNYKDLAVSPKDLASTAFIALKHMDDIKDTEDGTKYLVLFGLYLFLFILTVLSAILALFEIIKERSLTRGVPVFLGLMCVLFLVFIVLSIYANSKMMELIDGFGFLSNDYINPADLGVRPTLWGLIAVLFAVPIGYYQRLLQRTEWGQKALAYVGNISSEVAVKAKDVAKDAQSFAQHAGSWDCPECGNHVERGAKFCPKCGTERPPEPEARFCHKCGTKLQDGALFCEKCGTRVVDAGADPQEKGQLQIEKTRQDENLAGDNPAPQKPKVMLLNVSAEEAEAGAVKKLRLPDGQVKQLKIPAGVEDGKKFKVKSSEGDVVLQVRIK